MDSRKKVRIIISMLYLVIIILLYSTVLVVTQGELEAQAAKVALNAQVAMANTTQAGIQMNASIEVKKISQKGLQLLFDAPVQMQNSAQLIASSKVALTNNTQAVAKEYTLAQVKEKALIVVESSTEATDNIDASIKEIYIEQPYTIEQEIELQPEPESEPEQEPEPECKPECKPEPTQESVPDDVSTSTGPVLTRSGGVNYFNGHTETWYSERVLPGYGLNIPGRHTDENGLVRDGDGYICVASSDYSNGTIIETSLGMGKVYDCGCPSGIIDIYTNW